MSLSITNVVEHLGLMATSHPDTIALAIATSPSRNGSCSYRRMTFAELHRYSDQVAHELSQHGIAKLTRTVLMVKPSVEFFGITFALFKLGAVPVLIDPGLGIANLKTCIAHVEPEAFIGIPKAHIARILFGWGGSSITKQFTVGSRLFWGGARVSSWDPSADEKPCVIEKADPQQMAAILFTSGSTGIPKGAVYSHANFTSQVRLLQKTYNIVPGETDLSTFPLFALFSPALGMASIVPYMDATRPAKADPRNLIAAITDFSCTNLFGSPAVVNLLGRYCEQERVTLPSLRRVISGGAPASPASLERFSRALDDAVEIFTPYGATESLPVSSIGSHRILNETRKLTEAGAGVCVGFPVDEMQVAIIAITEDPIERWSDDLALPAGKIGEIVVNGPVVTLSYYNDEIATQKAKIFDEARDVTWHRMGDVGYLDEQGQLWMCGRKSHRVITATETMFTIPCEAVFNTHPRVFRTALVGVLRSNTIEPVLCVEIETPCKRAEQTQLQNELLAIAAQHPHTRSIKTILFHPAFPVDIRHNAKIFRERLARWAQKKLS